MEQSITRCSRKQDISDFQEDHKDNVIQTSLRTVDPSENAYFVDHFVFNLSIPGYELSI